MVQSGNSITSFIDRCYFVCECCALLAVPVFSYLVYCILSYKGAPELALATGKVLSVTSSVSLSSIVPMVGLIVILIVLVLFPGLTGGTELQMPLNVTLPSIHIAATYATSILLTTQANAILAQPPALAPLILWQNPILLAMIWSGQVCVLSTVAFFRHRKLAKRDNASQTPQDT